MKIIALPLLLALGACASITSSTSQEVTVTTEPAGASCSLQNEVGRWEIAETPGSAEIHRSFSPLTIYCESEQGIAKQVIDPRTRGRAYGNILLLGFPAYVDASTGAGYEYEPATVNLELKPKSAEIQ